MDHQKGLASIPLILGLAIMVVSTSFALNLTKQNQNFQNRAAFNSSEVPCAQFTFYYKTYCNNTRQASASAVPCKDALDTINTYCSNTVIPTPPVSTYCKPGQSKTFANFNFTCINGKWRLSRVNR